MRQHRFVAHSFTKRFAIDKIAKEFGAGPTSTDPGAAVFRPEGDGSQGIFIYNFGAITFWNCEPEFIRKYVAQAEQAEEADIAEAVISEDYSVEETDQAKPSVKFNCLVIDNLTPERAEVVALTLAQSAAMEFYERQVDSIWLKVAALVEPLKKKGRVSPAPRRFHRLIADVVEARSSVIGVLHLLDRPDLIWDDATMDAVYSDLRASFDLDERFQALQYKLDNVRDTLEIIIDMARDGRLFLLEAAIVALILIEIILTLIKW